MTSGEFGRPFPVRGRREFADVAQRSDASAVKNRV